MVWFDVRSPLLDCIMSQVDEMIELRWVLRFQIEEILIHQIKKSIKQKLKGVL
jgi:hypothetical protein